MSAFRVKAEVQSGQAIHVIDTSDFFFLNQILLYLCSCYIDVRLAVGVGSKFTLVRQILCH